MAKTEFEIRIDCSMEQLKEDVAAGFYEILDDIQIGSNGVDLRLSLYSERDDVLVHLCDCTEGEMRTGTSGIAKSNFMEMSMSDLERFVDQVYFYNMVEQ